jgi:glyoxylase-like metal-dependent hydrolase (beta-lactamase superfamily II)
MSQPADPSETGVTFALGAWQEVAPNVFRAVAEPESVNLGLVVGSERALLVDTGSSPVQGAAVRASVAAVTDRPLTAVAVTHWHYDHAFGLAAFTDLLTIGHESVRGRLGSAEARAEAARLGVDAADLAAPGRELAVATAVDLGDRRVEIAHLGEGHTDGDLVVVVPDADVVFAGDLIESAGPPSFGDDAVPGAWAATLDGVIGLMTASTVLVPGHGDPVDREFVFEQRGRIAARAAAGILLAGRTVTLRG